jgi:hypothetical protein
MTDREQALEMAAEALIAYGMVEPWLNLELQIADTLLEARARECERLLALDFPDVSKRRAAELRAQITKEPV